MSDEPCACQICVPEDLTDPLDQKCVFDVIAHGWHVVAVSEGHGESEPAFAYTVGLWHGARHPELVMSGQRVELMHHALNAAARRIMSGFPLTPGMTAENVIGRFPVLVDAMTDEGMDETIRFSYWFHRACVDAVQLVWPDTRGIWPWQPGGPDYSELQPQRWRLPAARTGAVAVDPEWVFPVPPDTLTWTCVCIQEKGAPVLLVTRTMDVDGEIWQLVCGSTDHDWMTDARPLHFSHHVRSAPSLLSLHDLAFDEQAEREATWLPWRRSPL